MENLSDEALMILVAEGNLDGMEPLFKRYHRRIYNYCLLMSKEEEISKDMTQEVFYKIIQHRKTYKYTRFSSWIFTIARNLCNDHYKTLKKKPQYVNDLSNLSVSSDQMDEYLGSEERLHQALNKLADADKELIIMSKFQKLKYQEIAEIIGAQPGAVKTRTHRAMVKLKEQYFKKT